MSFSFQTPPASSNMAGAVLFGGMWTGAGAANLTKVYGKQLTAARQGVGVHRITFSGKGNGKPIVIAQVQGTAALLTTVGAYNSSTGVIDITCMTDAGVATELSSAESLGVIVLWSDASSV